MIKSLNIPINDFSWISFSLSFIAFSFSFNFAGGSSTASSTSFSILHSFQVAVPSTTIDIQKETYKIVTIIAMPVGYNDHDCNTPPINNDDIHTEPIFNIITCFSLIIFAAISTVFAFLPFIDNVVPKIATIVAWVNTNKAVIKQSVKNI